MVPTVHFSRVSLRAHVSRAVLSAAAIASMLMPLGQPAASAATLHHLFRPAGASFEVAFPVKPVVDANTDPLFADFPGAEAAHGYYVTPVKRDILASARLQAPAPTYVVLTALYESPQQASAAAVLSASVDQLKPATIDGFPGYQAVSPVPSPAGASNPLHVVESISLLARGDQLFTTYAFTLTSRTAQAFTHSIRVFVGAAAVATASAAAVPTAVKAQGGGHRNAELFGGLLVVLLVAGAGYWYVQRRRASEAAAPPIAGYGPQATGTGNSQFGWMYEPPTDAAPPAAEATTEAIDPSTPRDRSVLS